MAQVFLCVADGRTLWVPTHKAAPHETGNVVILPQANSTELVRSFYLFDHPVQVVEDPRFVTSPATKTPADVSRAVAQFRERCARDEPFMMSSRYNPNSQRPAPQAAQPPQHIQSFQQPQQYNMPPAAAAMLPPPSMQQQQPTSYPMMNQSFLQPPAFNGAPMHHQHHQQHQYHHQQQQPMNPYGGYNQQQMGRGGYQQGAPYGGHQQHHHHHQQRFGGPGGMQQQQQQQGGPQARFQDIVFNKPQPIELPVEVPKEVRDLYQAAGSRIYLATLPAARITVWLRSHTMTPSNYQRYVHCKGGVSLMMKTSAVDVLESKPVELFDRQLCTHFLAHNYCSRKGCLHVHHSEAQLREMVAVKHVLLQDTSKREREQMADDIVAKDRAAQGRPKEDFETRYAIVMAMPPTVVTGTPAHLVTGVASNESDTQAVPNILAVTGGNRAGGRPLRDEGGSFGDPAPSQAGGFGGPAPPPAAPRPGRYTGPIGVASDSDSDSSDTSSSSSDSSDDSGSDSSSDAGSDAPSSKDGDNEESEATAEQKAQNAANKSQAKEYKKKLRKLVDDMKAERLQLEKQQKKEFHRIGKDADESRHQIRKREKKERKSSSKRGRSRSDEDHHRRRRSTSRRRD